MSSGRSTGACAWLSELTREALWSNPISILTWPGDGGHEKGGQPMLRGISDMPVGTIGFEAVGEVEDDDWEETVEPVLRREIAEGRDVRLLYLIGGEAREVEGDAMSADTGFRVRHATSFERVAVVSDEDWIRPALRGLSFLLPGKARGFRVRDLAEAKAWLAKDGD
jgi:SpoIIAA-like